MNWVTLVLGLLLGVVANEVFDLSAWAARRVVVAAARAWTTDPDQRATYAEEWQALIAERPGNLSKLVTAALLLGAGLAKRTWGSVGDRAVLGWITMALPVKQRKFRRRAMIPKSVPREFPGSVNHHLRLALWANYDLPGTVATARVLAARTRSSPERGEALVIAATGLLNLGRDDELAAALEDARTALRHVDSSRLSAHVDVIAALAAIRSGDSHGGLTGLATAASKLLAADDNYETLFAWQDLAVVSSYVGHHEQAVAALQRTFSMAQRIGIPTAHIANPSIHLRRALFYDHLGNADMTAGLLADLVKQYRSCRTSGALLRMRATARGSYGYALARLAATHGGRAEEANGLLESAATSSVGREMRVLGSVCLAIAGGRHDEALATLVANSCDSMVKLGRGEPHRIRALALKAGGELGASLVPEQRAREAAIAEQAHLPKQTTILSN